MVSGFYKVMGHPTNTQIFKAIKEGIKEVIEKMEEYNNKLEEKLKEIERRLDNGDS